MNNDGLPLRSIQNLYPADAVLIIAAAGGAVRLEAQIPTKAMVRIVNAPAVDDDGLASRQLFSRVEGPAMFQHANLSRESGLFPIAALQALWQNLQVVSEKPVETTTLLAFFDQLEADHPANAANWLVVDSFPAADILSGAGAMLARFDVILVRAILASEDEKDLYPASLDRVGDILAPGGFRQIMMKSCTHPRVVRSLFVRDWKTAFDEAAVIMQSDAAELVALRSEAAKLVEVLKDQNTQIERFRSMVEARDRTISERRSEIAALQLAVKHADRRVEESQKLNLQLEGEISNLASESRSARATADRTDAVIREAAELSESVKALEASLAQKDIDAQDQLKLLEKLSANNSSLTIIAERAEDSFKRELLAEARLENLQEKYRNVSEQNLALTRALLTIRNELKAIAAQNEAGAAPDV